MPRVKSIVIFCFLLWQNLSFLGYYALNRQSVTLKRRYPGICTSGKKINIAFNP